MQKGENESLDKASLAQWRFMVVDDDPIVNRLALFNMQKVVPGAKTFSFKNGKEFCDFLQQEQVEANEHLASTFVLLDISMPKMDGHAVLKFLKDKGYDVHLWIAIYTSSINPEDHKNTTKYDFVIDFIEKPLKPARLSQALARLV